MSLEQLGILLPLDGNVSLTITVIRICGDTYRLDLDNLLTGVMSSLDDKPFMPSAPLLRDDEQITSVHLNLETITGGA